MQGYSLLYNQPVEFFVLMKKVFFIIAIACICFSCIISAGCIERHFEKTETVLVKFNSTGTAEWTTVIENTGYASSVSFPPSNQVIQTSDRGFLIAGIFTDSASGKKGIRLVNLGPNGNLRWEKRMPGEGVPLVVIRRPDGGFLLCNPYGRVLGFNITGSMESVTILLTQIDDLPNGESENGSRSSLNEPAGSDLIVTGSQTGTGLERFTLTRISSNGTVIRELETGLNYDPVFDAGGSPPAISATKEEVIVNLPVYINGSVIPPKVPEPSGLPAWFLEGGAIPPGVIGRMVPENTQGNPDIWLDSVLKTDDGGIALLGSRYYYPGLF